MILQMIYIVINDLYNDGEIDKSDLVSFINRRDGKHALKNQIIKIATDTVGDLIKPDFTFTDKKYDIFYSKILSDVCKRFLMEIKNKDEKILNENNMNMENSTHRDNKIIEAIIEKYKLADKDDHGYYYIELISDIKNAGIESDIADLFFKNNFKNIEDVHNAINDFIYESYMEVEADMLMELCDEIAEHWDEFADYKIDFVDLKELVWEIVYVDYDDIYKDIYDLKLNCFIALTNTNDEMNYDFSESNLWEIRRNDSGSGDDGEFTYNDFEKLHNSNRFLCLSQGENMKLLYDYIFNYGETKFSAFIDSLGEEYMNATYGGCFVFLCKMNVGDYIKIKFGDAKNWNISISKDAVCGIFDWTNGSGGPLEVELNNDIVIKPGMFKLFIDGEIGYDIAQTYGLVDDMWKENIIKFMSHDKKVLESLINKYGVDGVKCAINKLNEALDKPLFRTPVKFVKRHEDDINDVINSMINDGEIDYADIYDLDINDNIIDEIMERACLYDTDNMNTRRWVLEIISKYYEDAYAEHLNDIDDMNEGKVNEWNMWDGMPRERQVTRINHRPSQPVNTRRYEDEPEYHEYIKQLETEYDNSTDEQEREYLWRRIEKLRSLSRRNRY